MSSSKLALLGLACAALSVSSVPAQSVPDVDPKLRARFGFLDPVVHKLAWGIKLMQPTRWKAGASLSLLVNNPHHARVEDLRLRDGRLGGDHIAVSGDIAGMATNDVDGNGHLDLLMFSRRGRLVVVFRGPEARKSLDLEVGLPATDDAMRCGDLDGDGRADVALLVRDQGLRLVTKLHAQPQISSPQEVLGRRVLDFCMLDVDGDQRLDLLVCGNEAPTQLQLKRNLGRGEFGPWILLGSPPLRRVFAGAGAAGRATLATIHQRPRRLVEYRLRTQDGASRPALCLYALPRANEPRAFAQGDLDGDGQPDLVLADAKLARLSFYFERNGRYEVRHAPTLSGVRSLALGDLDGDGKLDLLLASPEEKTLAWIPGKAGLQSFPKSLLKLPKYDDEPAQPQAVAVAGQEVFVLVNAGSRSASLLRLRGAGLGEPKVESLLDFRSMRRTPQRLLVGDFDGQHGTDLAFVVPGVGLKLLFRNAAQGFVEMEDGAVGFAASMADGALQMVEGNKPDAPALLVVRERFARKIRFDKQGQVEILHQDNGPQARPTLSLGLSLDAGTRVFLDGELKRLFYLPGRGNQMTLHLPPVTPSHVLRQGRDLILLGANGLVRVPFGRSYELEPLRSFDPLKPKTEFYAGLAADFDGDGKPEIALLDNELHGLHILVPDGDKLRRALSFPVFETNDDRSRGEPRGIAAADLNGDGLQDLCLIAHDRVLIYTQER